MEGIILGIDEQKSEGAIKANDGNRYNFVFAEWKGAFSPESNLKVDFDVKDGSAVAVYPLEKPAVLASTFNPKRTFNPKKSKVTAIILTLFLGGFGGHQFYLGSWGLGIVYLVFFWTWIPVIFAVIELIRYVTLSDNEFEAKAAQLDGPFGFLW